MYVQILTSHKKTDFVSEKPIIFFCIGPESIYIKQCEQIFYRNFAIITVGPKAIYWKWMNIDYCFNKTLFTKFTNGQIKLTKRLKITEIVLFSYATWEFLHWLPPLCVLSTSNLLNIELILISGLTFQFLLYPDNLEYYLTVI